MVTVRDLLQIFRNKVAIAQAFNVSRQAVTLWGIDNPIPEDREKQFVDEILPNLPKPKITISQDFETLLKDHWYGSNRS